MAHTVPAPKALNPDLLLSLSLMRPTSYKDGLPEGLPAGVNMRLKPGVK